MQTYEVTIKATVKASSEAEAVLLATNKINNSNGVTVEVKTVRPQVFQD